MLTDIQIYAVDNKITLCACALRVSCSHHRFIDRHDGDGDANDSGGGASEPAPIHGKWRLYSRWYSVSWSRLVYRAYNDGLRRDEKDQQREWTWVTTMAMSNLYSKISTKPMKRFQDNVAVKQTNAWMNGERERERNRGPLSRD